MNRLLVGWCCAGLAVALVIFSIYLSSRAAPSGMWLTILIGLILLLVGMFALSRRRNL